MYSFLDIYIDIHISATNNDNFFKHLIFMNNSAMSANVTAHSIGKINCNMLFGQYLFSMRTWGNVTASNVYNLFIKM